MKGKGNVPGLSGLSRLLAAMAVGMALGALVCCGVYLWKTSHHRDVIDHEAPELAWLQLEFGLSDSAFERIRALHEGYRPRCAAMCQVLDERTALLRRMIGEGEHSSEAFGNALSEAVDVRARCQEMMWEHFRRVSQEMTPGQAERYLDWAYSQTMTPSHRALEAIEAGKGAGDQ